MNNDNTAFTLDIDLSEETLIDLTTMVDEIDNLRMVINGILAAPEENRTLERYVERATLYLAYLRDRIREEDLQRISTGPMAEGTRQRIKRVLRSSMVGARS